MNKIQKKKYFVFMIIFMAETKKYLYINSILHISVITVCGYETIAEIQPMKRSKTEPSFINSVN